MLGGVGGRHASVRRRGSSPGVHARRESPPASPRPPRRRRAAIAVSDHKTCALIHTRLKLGDIMKPYETRTSNLPQDLLSYGLKIFNFTDCFLPTGCSGLSHVQSHVT
ncbi:unnamed protein product, partial [Brenthis ino]